MSWWMCACMHVCRSTYVGTFMYIGYICKYIWFFLGGGKRNQEPSDGGGERNQATSDGGVWGGGGGDKVQFNSSGKIILP